METSIDPTKDRKCVVRKYSGDASDHRLVWYDLVVVVVVVSTFQWYRHDPVQYQIQWQSVVMMMMMMIWMVEWIRIWFW